MSKPADARKVKGRVPTLEQVSAGGVAFKNDGGNIEIAIVKIVPEMRWQLPKGLIDEGETPEEAALREVSEEAGIQTALIEELKRIEYWFFADRGGERTRFHKYVHFFLLRYMAGDVNDHDHEVAEARWVSPEDALKMLAFKTEREVAELGLRRIRELTDTAR